MTQEMQQDKSLQLLVMTKNGKLVFSEEVSQSLGLTENTFVKFGIDDTFSTYYLNISSRDNGGDIKLKKSGIYYYIACADMLRVLGLYSPVPTIYEMVRENESDSDSVYRLDKTVAIKASNISDMFPNKDELRSVLAMLNAKI